MNRQVILVTLAVACWACPVMEATAQELKPMAVVMDAQSSMLVLLDTETGIVQQRVSTAPG